MLNAREREKQEQLQTKDGSIPNTREESSADNSGAFPHSLKISVFTEYIYPE